MNREKLYYDTVDLLLDAYNNNKLKHGSCAACAVGNICNGNDHWQHLFYTAYGVQKTINSVDVMNKILPIPTGEEISTAYEVISKTGYSLEELQRIEFAFENSIYDYNLLPDEDKKIIESMHGLPQSLLTKVLESEVKDKSIINKINFYYYLSKIDTKRGQYLGLVAVLNTLKDIHSAPDIVNDSSQFNLTSIYNTKCELV